MLPVTVQEEDFSVTIGEDATKSKYVYENGKYPAICESLEKGTTQKGDPKLVLKFLGTGGAAQGKEFQMHLSLSQRAEWKLVQVMSAFGINVDPVTRALPISKTKVVGKAVVLDLAAEERDNGRTYMEIQTVEPAASSGPAPY